MLKHNISNDERDINFMWFCDQNKDNHNISETQIEVE
jgi:hypothetical protein